MTLQFHPDSLTATQKEVIYLASLRLGHAIFPLPKRLHKGLHKKVIQGLTNKNMIEKKECGYVLSSTGIAHYERYRQIYDEAFSASHSSSESEQQKANNANGEKPECSNIPTINKLAIQKYHQTLKEQAIEKAIEARQSRSNAHQADPQKSRVTKSVLLLEGLRRDEGITLEELVEKTGWQKHSLRGAISQLKSKHRLTITSERRSDGKRVYYAK